MSIVGWNVMAEAGFDRQSLTLCCADCLMDSRPWVGGPVKTMKSLILILVLLLLAPVTWGQTPVDSAAKVEAARANAMAGLHRQVYQANITPDLTVRQFIKLAGGQLILQRALDKAAQIGAPRWVDGQLCQVRLQVSGLRLAGALQEIASNTPDLSPIPPTLLQSELLDWKYRTFSATGVNFSPDNAGPLAPVIQAARADATQRLVDHLLPIRLSENRTIDQSLSDDHRRQLMQWLNDRPVAEVEVTTDRTLTLRLAVSADALAETVGKLLSPGVDAAAYAGIARQIGAEVADVRGTAALQLAATTVPKWRPPEAPDWANDELEAEGFSRRLESKLRTARAAETDGLARLREKVLKLQVGGNVSLAEVTKEYADAAEAINRATLRTRVVSTDYHPDGSVTVRISLRLGGVWDALADDR